MKKIYCNSKLHCLYTGQCITLILIVPFIVLLINDHCTINAILKPSCTTINNTTHITQHYIVKSDKRAEYACTSTIPTHDCDNTCYNFIINKTYWCIDQHDSTFLLQLTPNGIYVFMLCFFSFLFTLLCMMCCYEIRYFRSDEVVCINNYS